MEWNRVQHDDDDHHHGRGDDDIFTIVKVERALKECRAIIKLREKGERERENLSINQEMVKVQESCEL